MTPSGNSDSHSLPYDFSTARTAIRQASLNMIAAEATLKQAFKDSAQAEESYRVALARRITELHADGAAWSACGDLARGDRTVAHLRYLRDVAEGVKEAAQQAMWRLTADRRDLGRLVDWSRRAGDGTGEQTDPAGLRSVA